MMLTLAPAVLATQEFVKTHRDVLSHFRLTGTASTMKMLRSVMPPNVVFGPTWASGPLGGDAQVRKCTNSVHTHNCACYTRAFQPGEHASVSVWLTGGDADGAGGLGRHHLLHRPAHGAPARGRHRETLLRMADMNNVMHATNPTTALALVPVLDAVARGSAAWSQK